MNRRKQTDYDRRTCAVLCWVIGALAAWIAVLALMHNDLHILNYFVKMPL